MPAADHPHVAESARWWAGCDLAPCTAARSVLPHAMPGMVLPGIAYVHGAAVSSRRPGDAVAGDARRPWTAGHYSVVPGRDPGSARCVVPGRVPGPDWTPTT